MTQLDTWEWFGNRTFHYSQFEPLAKLRSARERTGTTISICLPARNEAATIGPMVAASLRAGRQTEMGVPVRSRAARSLASGSNWL